MDDIWDIEAWDDFRKYFPDDYNGSRILFTSRVLDVSRHFRSHPLRFLNEDESWDLFSERVFQKENCPAELMEIGKQIAKKCQGIVVIAGLLKKNDKTLEWRRHVAKSRILEDVAEGYLMDLIDRSLVLVVRRKSTGGIKSCRVHDLLHDLCLKKAVEENFLQQICWYEEVSSSGFTADKQLFLPIAAKQCRLCVRSPIFGGISSEFSAQHIRSFLYFGSEKNPIRPKDISFLERGFNLLRVLDLSSISISQFPCSIAQLVLLRYLAIKGKEFHLPDNISEFQNLETLIVSGQLDFLPISVWKMVKLRHLCIGGGNLIPDSLDMDIYSLDGLQTISQVCPSKGCQKVLTRTPNLRKLVLCGRFELEDRPSQQGLQTISQVSSGFWFPELEFLDHLKVLKLFNRFIPANRTYNLQGVKFPPNLKELTLSKTNLAWEEMSIIGSLPNLESLN
ncbi:putative late blight resistance protein homolog R1A-3 [Cornus florida]|uniref:putative late blight resistance protein homolog R1A-3 n=1 Tax=Cornus florida TaxID=4283 RepID=UPI00289F1A8F|nr:putative late blight resistance protein homolog R1A-3 [Cornus florida]